MIRLRREIRIRHRTIIRILEFESLDSATQSAAICRVRARAGPRVMLSRGNEQNTSNAIT